MAPNVSIPTGVLHENDDEVRANFIPPEVVKPSDRKLELVWRNIVLFTYLHAVAVYGLYLMFTSAKLVTSIYGILLYQMGGLGITAGAHRLWAHRSYKAKWPLKLILTAFNTLAFENSVIEWARDHRVHHKFSETDADPHNAKRGFFFSHVGWLLCRKHPDVKAKGKAIDLSDLEQDPILAFQIHQPRRKPDSLRARLGRRLAQLPPYLPLGLQDLRAGQVQRQLLGSLHRLLRQGRMGVRPQNCVRGHDQEEGEEDRRRHPRDLGVGRQGPAPGGLRGCPNYPQD
ncbi:unnamed protein product [Phaedon cochleariae]|uniref:Uncharacterized protein n=1 Tax=Phaedon cochleariae TaxID=80249 RepID=A0A9N9SG26_PHACE|nr:unnamed protein product [Phaedon cochleariae]